ncbi:asparaginase [Methylobacter sp. BBA5.1]|uniref:asparaginase n=1 Tax=Methylobacter sp. BBA5.1 TaxID=1495064 RepID=UPI00055FBCE2|nr:asparaginase domain-containing protein [Methylobacter sp. BBA5.1]
MKNILVVFTGGTIGSTAIGGTISTSDAAPYKLIQLFQQHHASREQISFHSIQPIQILSENLAPVVWEKLIAVIEAQDIGRYDGIIITHGTDTLAFTAAALDLYFNTLNIPILLVSSDRPLDHPEANGLPNFICAVEYILQRHEPGVFVPYTNRNQATQLHRGTRLASSLQLGGDFMSVQGKSHCRFVNGAFTQNGLTATGKSRQRVPLKADFSKRVLLVKPYPGLDYRYINLDAVDVVLHDLYHSGTACSSAQWGDQFSLLVFIRQCRERGIKVYLAPAVKSDNAYESTRELLEAGAEMIWNLSLETAYVKLLLAYGNFSDERQIMDFIDRDVACEHV